MEHWDRITDPGARVELRTRAVQAVMAGEKRVLVARRYRITRQTLHTWMTRHRLGGPEALVARPPGRARRQVLAPWQETLVADAIRVLPPWTVEPRRTRWTKKLVAAFVEQRFGVRLSAWQVDSHLRRWGFGSHKEARRAFLNVPAPAGASTQL